MNRPLYASLIAATVLLGAQVPVAVQASTLTYDVTLTAISGPESGSGSFTITAPSTGSGTLTMNNGLTAMDFKIDGLDFSLDSSSGVAYSHQGSSLVLAGLIYGGQIGTNQLFSISLGSNGLYSFTDSAPGGSAYDTFGSVSVSQTPLPTSLPLLATGLGALAMFGWWRKRKVGSPLAA
jgi:hypothetical protein